MKKFCKKILLFITCITATLVVYNIWLEWNIDCIDTLREETKILVLGDSHLECGINDENYPIFENRCMGSETYFLNYRKFKSIVERNDIDNIDAICLSYNFFIAKFRDSLFVGDQSDYFIDSYSPAFRQFQNIPSKYDVPINHSYTLPIRSRIPNLKHLTLEAWRGGYYCHTESNIDSSSDLLKNQIDRHQYRYCDDDLANYISKLQINDLKKIANYAKQLNIPLFLINTPQHPDYNNLVPKKLVDFHYKLSQDLSRDYGAIYFDYHNMKLPDSYFFDYDHLNSCGAEIFTQILIKDITSFLESQTTIK